MHNPFLTAASAPCSTEPTRCAQAQQHGLQTPHGRAGPTPRLAGDHEAMNEIETDVVVVGARCAGAASAMLLARQDINVVVVDRATQLGDTMSTHAITRGGVVQLDRWGLLDDVLATGTPAITKVTFHIGSLVHATAVKPRAGVGFLIAPRRRMLDNLILDAAAADGAEVRLGISVDEVIRNSDGRVTGVAGRAADGTTDHGPGAAGHRGRWDAVAHRPRRRRSARWMSS